MTSSLVGSEMCIRDRLKPVSPAVASSARAGLRRKSDGAIRSQRERSWTVSYTHLTLPTICSV
eukprot:11875022-Prorocentrum_lima.AAC.1